MKRLPRLCWNLISSPFTCPSVIGIFVLVYIGIAFITDDALIVLMELVRRNGILVLLLALLPIASLARLIKEIRCFRSGYQISTGDPSHDGASLFDEAVELETAAPFDGIEETIRTQGYTIRKEENRLAAWRGITHAPARLIFLLATLCLYSGIFISLIFRTSYRGPVIEGEPMPGLSQDGGIVERIRLENGKGTILSKRLTIDVAPSGQGGGQASFGIYPPGLYQGSFVYPRYLGIALLVRFSAPDMHGTFEKHAVLNMYPAGKEAEVQIPESPYKLVTSLAEPDDGLDPYITGRMVFNVKLSKDKDVVLSGVLPGGGELNREGYCIAFPDYRRMVLTDFIQDYGVYFIWGALSLYGIALLYWLPVRVFFPRREMLFVRGGINDMVTAYSRTEGRERSHNSLFHNLLDMLDIGKIQPGG